MTTAPTTPAISGSPLVMPGSVPVAPVQTARAPRAPKPADKRGWWWGTGRRKSAVARIRMKPAEGEKATVTIEAPNGKVKTIEQFFSEERDRNDAVAPLKMNGLMGRVQVIAKVHGGGFMGQAGAVKLAIARAVLDYDPSFEDALREAGMLTRDARKVERKKYGQAGARRRFQFSKR
jgi:small subunit ribosomal protein S9